MAVTWKQIRGYAAGGVAAVTCPCHLVITLPLLLSLTAGTALGAFLSENIWAIIAASVLLFATGLILAFRWLGQGERSCILPTNQTNRTRSMEGESWKEVSIP